LLTVPNTLRTIHLNTEMESFVATYGTPDGQDATIGGANALVGASQGYITSGYLGCNTDLLHDYSDTTYDFTEFFQTGVIATKNCISRYGARDLIGNYPEWFDGYHENTNNSTTRQRSVYWGTADRVTTVISDAILGYALPTGTQTISVSDWDYQNLLPKPPYVALTAPSVKFFSDVFFIAAIASPLVSSNNNYGRPTSGSRAGRFQRDISAIPTNSGSYVPRCAITSP